MIQLRATFLVVVTVASLCPGGPASFAGPPEPASKPDPPAKKEVKPDPAASCQERLVRVQTELAKQLPYVAGAKVDRNDVAVNFVYMTMRDDDPSQLRKMQIHVELPDGQGEKRPWRSSVPEGGEWSDPTRFPYLDMKGKERSYDAKSPPRHASRVGQVRVTRSESTFAYLSVMNLPAADTAAFLAAARPAVEDCLTAFGAKN